MLGHALSWLDENFRGKFSIALLRDHSEIDVLRRNIHRFRALDESGLRALAKDVVKFSIERIDKKSLLHALGEKKSELGTLKLFQALIAKYTDRDYAQNLMAPLFGVYDLRLADAHLSNSDLDDCYSRIGVSRNVNFTAQAAALMLAVATALGVAGTELKKHA